MYKKVLFLALVFSGLCFSNCSNSPKNVKVDEEKVSEKRNIEKEGSVDSDKLIEKYESRGIALTDDQKVKIVEVVKNVMSSGDSNNNIELKRKARSIIEAEVLNEEQRSKIKKRKR